ncbi:WXG100 family type VII secretion target [Prauserella alba]|uniref:Excreted virulence factor EspC, type VII ESX diderm n=1 Tax=Prauserella alba TaxID=176898 RepID=A0ABN1VNT9_9PSEU|nr:hypothetical protein [Prauserella alba]MCP2180868.1 hypothetical protein [Prauserella alba]
MALNIEVEAQSASLREVAGWLRTAGKKVSARHEDVTSASNNSEDGWDGEGATAFRRNMLHFKPKIDDLSAGYGGLANAIDLHAADIDTTNARMGQAVEIAKKGGLTVTDKEIQGPGEPPPKPEPAHRHAKSGAISSDDKERFDAQWDTYTAWVKKAKAYTQAGTVVTEARKIETDSQSMLLDYLKNVGQKWYINAPDFGTGLAAAHIAAHNSFKTTASNFRQLGSKLGDLADDATRGSSNQARYLVASLVANSKANVQAAQAEGKKFGKWLNKLPGGVKKALTSTLANFVPRNAKYLAGAKPLLAKLPAVGTTLGGFSLVDDLAQGKDPTVTVLSNGGSIVAGAAAGSAIGGPPGALAGFIAATGTGFLIENFASDDVKAALDVMSQEGYQNAETNPWLPDLKLLSKFTTGNW